MTPDELVVVDRLTSLVEAQLVGEVLGDRGVPHVLRSFRDTAYGALFQSQWAWGEVLAPAEWADEVRAVLAEVRESPGPLSGFE